LFSYRAADGSKFTATLFFLLVQCLTNTALAGAAVLALGTSTSGTSTSGTSTSSTSSDKDKCKSEDKEQAVAPSASASVSASPPALDYVTAGVSYICAMLCSTEALKFVSLPMQALGKSCKMVPVMLFGFLIRGKRYSFRETLAVLLITAGITVFQQKKGSSSGSGSAVGGDHANYGLALLFLSLVLDGVTGACQDRMRERYHPSTHQVRGVFVACSWRVRVDWRSHSVLPP
jgi:UDP-galactose transporter B1